MVAWQKNAIAATSRTRDSNPSYAVTDAWRCGGRRAAFEERDVSGRLHRPAATASIGGYIDRLQQIPAKQSVAVPSPPVAGGGGSRR
jgi:hypothetical protein